MTDRSDKIRIDSILIERAAMPEGRSGWFLTGSVLNWKERPRDRKCRYDENSHCADFAVTREDLGQQSRQALRYLLKTTKPFSRPDSGRMAWIFFYQNGQWIEPEY